MTKNVLAVDDMSSNREQLKAILEDDYAVIEAASGTAALDILARRHSDISAVLLDIRMPDIDGLEVLRRIRADVVFSQIPIIMMTGNEDEESRVNALSLGANDYITKPYNPEIIRHCLSNNIALSEAVAAVNLLEKDRLTGIWNKDAFFQRAALAVNNKPDGYFIFSCSDIEGFKVVNDQYGSDVGDRILRAIGRALQLSCDEHGGLCGHIFADRFVGLYPLELAQTGLVSPHMLENHVFESTGVNLTISAGRYVVKDRSLPVSAMYDRAAIAKNTVKGRYDTHVAVFDESMRDQIVHEQIIVNEMNAALTQKQFEVWYQPQYNHSTNAMIGAEALVRWRHPQRGMIPPGDFISIFEQNGFIYALDKFVWEEVCCRLRGWLDEKRSPLPISVNISRYDLLQPDVVNVLSGLIEKYAIPIELLRLEITESAFAKTAQHIVDVVRELLSHGFTVEIDDFGSGYSSLNTLKDVPAQIVKLDMKFLESSGNSQRGGNIVESIVRMAKWLDMSVIAEGVETPEQADYLRSVGCSYIQGYLYARPMPVDKYEEHCAGNFLREKSLLSLETIENLDNNTFWDPKSMDTLIFNSYVGGACIYEYHNGGIELLRVTEKYMQVVGSTSMTVEDALRLNWIDHLAEESKKRVVADLEQSIATKSEVSGEYVFLDLPGCPHETYLRSSMRVIASTGERHLVYCTNENVTAQRQAELKAREAAEQMQTLMDDMPGGFVRIRMFPDGRLEPVYVNEGLASLVGMSYSELQKIYRNDSYARIHPDDKQLVKDVVYRLVERGESPSIRYRLMRGDGKYIWLCVLGRVTKDASGNTFLNVYYSDASEQVKEEETQRALLDNLPSGAGIYEFKDGQMSLTYQNKSYWDLVGLYEEAYPDASPMSAVHPDDLPLIMQELSAAIGQNRDVVCNIRLRHLTLGYRPVHLAGRVIHEENGSFLIYVTFTPLDAPAQR